MSSGSSKASAGWRPTAGRVRAADRTARQAGTDDPRAARELRRSAASTRGPTSPRVLLAWATGEVVEPDPTHSSVDPGAGAFLSARAREVADAAAAARSFVSVAAPTHAGGWIDPVVLVRRLVARQPASRLDLVAAILRLAPDGREAALASAADLAGEAGAVVRYALGGDEKIGPTAAWWVAAARVRAPGMDDPAVEKRHPGLGPDAGRAARIRLVPGADPRHWIAGIDDGDRPSAGRASRVDLPTVLMLQDPSSFHWTGRSDPAMFRWVATIQPGYREPWAAIGALLIARNVDWWSAEWGNRAFLEPFIDPVTSIGPHARRCSGSRSGQKEAGERGLATDVVRLALADGRLTAPDLAEGLTAAAALDCDRPNRWAISLADVAAESDAPRRRRGGGDRRDPARPGRSTRRRSSSRCSGSSTNAGRHGHTAARRRPPDRWSSLTSAGGQAGRLARSILSRG